MVVFPGGAPYDTLASHYLFFDNTFSDLGGVSSYTGRPNAESRMLFAIALVLVGIALACFGPAWKAWADHGEPSRFGTATSAFALLSGLGFISIAFVPWDTNVDTHDTVVRATFGLLAGFTLCLTVVQATNRAPRLWIWANVVSLIGLVGYALMQFVGPDLSTREGLRAQVGSQKVIVYACILNLALQAWGVRARAGLGPPQDLTAKVASRASPGRRAEIGSRTSSM